MKYKIILIAIALAASPLYVAHACANGPPKLHSRMDIAGRAPVGYEVGQAQKRARDLVPAIRYQPCP